MCRQHLRAADWWKQLRNNIWVMHSYCIGECVGEGSFSLQEVYKGKKQTPRGCNLGMIVKSKPCVQPRWLWINYRGMLREMFMWFKNRLSKDDVSVGVNENKHTLGTVLWHVKELWESDFELQRGSSTGRWVGREKETEEDNGGDGGRWSSGNHIIYFGPHCMCACLCVCTLCCVSPKQAPSPGIENYGC